jgi:hypothetical protein
MHVHVRVHVYMCMAIVRMYMIVDASNARICDHIQDHAF